MIRHAELNDIHEDLIQLLYKIPPAERLEGYIPKILTACASLARILDALNDRENQNAQDLRTITAHIGEDLARLERLLPG